MIRYGSHPNTPWHLTPRQCEVLGVDAPGRSNIAGVTSPAVSETAVVRETSRIDDQLDIFENSDAHRRVLAAVKWLTAQPAGVPART